ncbi:MAG: MG2 domain-containing protein, partial [Mucilaginibacter sp.]
MIREKLQLYGPLKNDKRFRDSLKYWQKKASLPKLLDKLSPPLKKEDVVTGPDDKVLFALGANGGALFITYNKYHHYNHGGLSMIAAADNTDNTLLMFDSPALLFDKNGMLINPGEASYNGVWSKNRVSALLPSDYEPQQTMETEVDSALVKNITAKVNAYTSTHITEKAYLHFDKPYYSAGDTIYFKAYLTQGEAHAPSHLSGILYVDLIDADNKIKKSEKLLVTDGVAWGDFALAQTLPKGNYRIRAYTQWMRNEGDAAFFDKTIPVASLAKVGIPESGVPAQKAPAGVNPAIKFLPEAGKLIAGVQNKVAFKAIGASGLGVDVKGTVIDDENKEVTTFESTHLGMGYFYLTPSATKTYNAKIVYADNTQDLIPLPKADANEIGLSFIDAPRAWSVKISCGKLWYQQNKKKSYTLVIYSGGVPHSFTVKLASTEINFDILKNDFPSGIATATLFSATGEPLCERLLFVQNNDLLKLSISTGQKVYAMRSKTSINLNIKTNTGQPAQGHFSVAVIDEARVPLEDNSESTIINNLLLTSDLKGFVEQPAYYITNPTDKTAADLDLVMLTHGYRSLEWQKMLSPSKTVLEWHPEK